MKKLQAPPENAGKKHCRWCGKSNPAKNRKCNQCHTDICLVADKKREEWFADFWIKV